MPYLKVFEFYHKTLSDYFNSLLVFYNQHILVYVLKLHQSCILETENLDIGKITK